MAVASVLYIIIEELTQPHIIFLSAIKTTRSPKGSLPLFFISRFEPISQSSRYFVIPLIFSFAVFK
jgi:hypothetical protein